MFPQKNDLLLIKFDTFLSDCVKVYTSDIRDKKSKNLLEEFQNNSELNMSK